MEYECTMITDGQKESWTGHIRLLNCSGTCYEAEITGRSTYFHVIAGSHCYGNYLCIPNHGLGSELSYYSDVFWNTERLSDMMSRTDAVTVAYGLSHLKELEQHQRTTEP